MATASTRLRCIAGRDKTVSVPAQTTPSAGRRNDLRVVVACKLAQAIARAGGAGRLLFRPATPQLSAHAGGCADRDLLRKNSPANAMTNPTVKVVPNITTRSFAASQVPVGDTEPAEPKGMDKAG